MVNSLSISRSFSKAAQAYEDFAAIQKHMVEEIDQRLDFFLLKPKVCLDLGSGTGLLTRKLQNRFDEAYIYALDIAQPMLETMLEKNQKSNTLALCADVHKLPLQAESVDLIVSSAMLQWSYDLPLLLKEVQRVLKPEGLFIFATFGPLTLSELRLAWQTVDAHPHVNPFVDMHDIGDMLMHSGLVDPVMDMHTMILEYKDWRPALNDVRGVGSSNLLKGRRKTLTGRQRWRKMIEELSRQSSIPEGYSMTYEVVHGHCFKGTPRPPKHSQPYIIDANSITKFS